MQTKAADLIEGAREVGKAEGEVQRFYLMKAIMDGWEATRRVKTDASTKVIPVIIALTAHAMGQDKEKAMAAGCNDFDTKVAAALRI